MPNPEHIQALKLKNKFSPEYPIMLFPLRVETRFIKTQQSHGGGTIDPTIGAVTTMAQTLTKADLTDAPDMDSLEQAIVTIQKQFATVQYEQTNAQNEGVTAISKWKLTLIDSLLEIHAASLIQHYRTAWTRLLTDNQSTAEFIEQISGAKLTLNEKTAVLSPNSQTLIKGQISYLIEQAQDIDSLEKFTASGLAIQQKRISAALQAWYQTIIAIPSLNPEDFSFINAASEQITAQANKWNEEALIHITKYGEHINVQEQKVQAIQEYFKEQHAQNVASTKWGNYAQNWQPVIKIKEHMRLFYQAQISFKFKKAFEAINSLERNLSLLEQNRSFANGIDDYTQAEISLSEQTINFLNDTASKAWTNYKNQVYSYQTQINEIYAYFQEILVDESLLQDGNESIDSFLKLADRLQALIYEYTSQVAQHDSDQTINYLSTIEELFFQLPSLLIHSKINDESDQKAFTQATQTLNKAHENLNSFILTQQKALGTQQETTYSILERANQRIKTIQQETFEQLPYIQYWKDLQANHFSISSNDFQQTAQNLERLVENYNKNREQLADNQHYATAEAIGKSQGLLTNTDTKHQHLITALNQWVNQFNTLSQQVSKLSWSNSEKALPLTPKTKESLNFWVKKASLLAKKEITADKINLNNAFFEVINQAYTLLNAIVEVSPQDILFLTGITANCKGEIEIWLKKLQQLIQNTTTKQEQATHYKKAIQAHLENLYAPIKKDNSYALWGLKFEMESHHKLMQTISDFNAPFQLNLIQKVQEKITAAHSLNQKIETSSLEYNHQIFEAVQEANKATQTYLQKHQISSNQLSSVIKSILDTQKNIDQLFLDQVLEIEATQNTEEENKTAALIQEAKQRLSIIEASPNPYSSVFLMQLIQLQASFKQLQHQVQRLEVIPKEVSELPPLFNNLKERIISWHQAFHPQQELNVKQLNEGKAIIEAIKIQTDRLGVPPSNSTSLANAAGPTFTPSLPPIICWYPLPGTGSGGGNGGGTTPDPVVVQEYELWIRVYPDYAAINTHDQKLTATEVQAGISFWTDYWFALDDRNLEIGAWRVLVEKFGSQRAAWIIKQLRPTNLNQKPRASITIDDGLYAFTQKLSTEHIQSGVNYWNNAIPLAQQPEALQNLKTTFEQSFPKGQAALLSYITRLPKISKALNPLNEKVSASSRSTALSASVLNAAVTKAQSIKVHQSIPSLAINFPNFPSLDPSIDIKSKAWDSSPSTHILPDQLVFTVYDNNGNLKYEELGNLIPQTLQTGPDPSHLEQMDPSKPDLGVKGNIKWMTDFQEAVDKGMAIRIPIRNEEGDPENIDAGFSKIFVTGVKHFDQEDPIDKHTTTFQNDSKVLLEQLLEGHHYAHTGMSILRPGTPTNNTSDQHSPFAAQSVEDTFEQEIVSLLPNLLPLNSDSDGQILANALGIDAKHFKSIENSAATSTNNAEQINRALWMSTWGYYLEEMDNNARILQTTQVDPIIPQSIIDFLKEDFFLPSVKGRGALPSIRIGKQPYGILPTSSFKSDNASTNGWAWSDILTGTTVNGVDKSLVYEHLTTILLEHLWGYRDFDVNINKSRKWQTIANEKIFTVDDPVGQNNTSQLTFSDGLTATQERFMEILRVHPRSVEFFSRYAMTIGSDFSATDLASTNVTNFDTFLNFNRTFDDEYSQFNLNASPSTKVSLPHSLLANIRLLNPINAAGESVGLAPLDGPIVDDLLKPSETRSLSSINGSSTNYIEWLLQNAPTTIYTKSKEHTEPSKSLLYHSLKNALFNEYWNACAIILEDTKKVPGNPTRYKDLMFRHRSHLGSHIGVSYSVYRNFSASLNAGNYSFNIDRRFYRERYRDFVVDVVDTIKGTASKDPEYADELIFANGRWAIMKMTILNGELNGLSSNQTLIDFVHQGVNNPQAPVRQEYPEAMESLLKFRQALVAISNLSTAELERLFSEHMDLASHRLDSWILGLVNQRLQQMRQTKTDGIYLGAYGWLLNLKPGGKRQELYGSSFYHVKAGGVIPEMIDPDNQGHIIAPSINHAITAAVLKSGYNAHLGGAEKGALAINLSSKRIRKALFYLDGIRNGQPLGALLGYQLERDLIDNNLGQYIQLLREHFPLNKNPNLLLGSAADLHNTIDGEAIIDALKTNPTSITTVIPSSDHALVIDQIDKLLDAIDALGDLAIAEGTYHVVGGNYARAGAMLKALSQQNYIPEPEVIQTPRTGRKLTHRVGMVFTPILSNTAIWATQLTPRAIAEPHLNHWLSQQLPNPQHIKCQVTYKVITGSSIGTIELSANDLGIEPIDWLYIFPDQIDQEGSELEKRFKQKAVEFLYSNQPTGLFNKFKVNFVDRDPAWGDEVVTIEEMSSLMPSLLQMVLKARPMTAVDLLHPSTPPNGNVDQFNINLVEVQQRVQKLQTIVINHKNQLQNNFASLWLTSLDNVDNTDIDIPEEPQLLIDYSEQFDRITKTLNQRLADYQEVLAKINPTLHHKKQFLIYQEAAQALLGKAFRLFPHFQAHNLTELNNCYQDRNTILPQVQPLEVEGWLMGLSRVREAMDDLEQVALMQDILGSSSGSSLRIAPLQLPYRANDSWVGLELPADYYPNHENDPNFVSLDKLSLVVDLPDNFNTQSVFVGMVIDEWTELIPHTEETIGVAFHYDEPNSEAPQAILLAVHPQTIQPKDLSKGINWNWNQLIDTLHSTIELAKIRAVEPDQLQSVQVADGGAFDAYSQLFPASYIRLQENSLQNDWYTDYGLNVDQPIYSPIPPSSNTSNTVDNISILTTKAD